MGVVFAFFSQLGDHFQRLDLVIGDRADELFERLGYLEGFGAGEFRFEGHLRRRPGEWFLDGEFFSASTLILERRFRAVSGSVFGDQTAMRFEIASGSYDGGRVTGLVDARGPMGLKELTTYKWIGIGEYLVRG